MAAPRSSQSVIYKNYSHHRTRAPDAGAGSPRELVLALNLEFRPAFAAVSTGVSVSLTLHDPAAAFAKHNLESLTSLPFKLGVRNATGRFYLTTLRSRTPTKLDFSLAVPPDEDLEVVFFSQNFDIQVSSGPRLDGLRGGGFKFRVPRANPAARPLQIELTVVPATRAASPSLIW